jgi:large subunit ribosomal protein L5
MVKQNKSLPRLREKFESEIRPEWMKDRGCPALGVPRLEKITLSMGLGRYLAQSKVLEGARDGLGLIAGQLPVWTRAKNSIAGFRLREGMNVGLKVTLRGARMYEFLDRLVTIAMPRIRDFRGISPKSFDGRGNFAMGIKEYHVFPEIDYDKIDSILGLNIVVCTTAKNNSDAKILLQKMGIPFLS